MRSKAFIALRKPALGCFPRWRSAASLNCASASLKLIWPPIACPGPLSVAALLDDYRRAQGTFRATRAKKHFALHRNMRGRRQAPAPAMLSPMTDIVSSNSIAEVAALIGDPARVNILSALMGGQALTAGELAWHARVSP